jgi:hypothetical protein
MGSFLTADDRRDFILDKIYSNGINSITSSEKRFLDSWKLGGEIKLHRKLRYEEFDIIIDSDIFRFEFITLDEFDDSLSILGVIYVPDIEFIDYVIDGRLEGKIIYYNDGQVSLDFSKWVKDPKTGERIEWDIFDFCDGIEYELESFVDMVIGEIENFEF